MTSDDSADVYRFFTEVGILNQLISTQLEALLPGRMSATQFGVLGHLARRPDGETPLHLANAFQVPKTSMSHMLAVLERLKLVQIVPNPADKRSKIVRITGDGVDFLQARLDEVARGIRPVIDQLGTAPFRDALPHLARIREELDRARD